MTTIVVVALLRAILLRAAQGFELNLELKLPLVVGCPLVGSINGNLRGYCPTLRAILPARLRADGRLAGGHPDDAATKKELK